MKYKHYSDTIFSHLSQTSSSSFQALIMIHALLLPNYAYCSFATSSLQFLSSSLFPLLWYKRSLNYVASFMEKETMKSSEKDVTASTMNQVDHIIVNFLFMLQLLS